MIHIYTSHNAFSFRLTALTALLVTAMTFLPQSLRAQNPTITTTFTGATRNNYDQIFLDYTSTPEGFDWDYSMSGYYQDYSSFSCTTDTENGGVHFSFDSQDFEYYLETTKGLTGSLAKGDKIAEIDVVIDQGVRVTPTISIGRTTIGYSNYQDYTNSTIVITADAARDIENETITINFRTDDSKNQYTNGLTIKAVRLYNLEEPKTLVPVVSVASMEETMGLGEAIEDYKNASVVLTADKKALFTFPVAANNDGYYEEGSDKLVLLNTPQGEIPTAQPGTVPFNKAFTGITLMVPAGDGTVTIDAKTAGAGSLAVVVGNGKPSFFKSDDVYKSFEVPYACVRNTYIYIYHTETSAASRGRAPGRKMANTTTLKSVKVKARRVTSAPPSPSEKKLLTRAIVNEIPVTDGHLVIDGSEYVDAEGDAFYDLDANAIKYIDLSKTSFASVANRSTMLWEKLPYTLVFLPEGCVAPESSNENFIIGDICENLQLKSSVKDDFPYDFLAINATLDTDLSSLPDQTTTVTLPFALDEEQAAAIGTFYQFKNIADGKVNMQPVATPEANKPYLLKASVAALSAEMVEVKASVSSAGARRAATDPEFVGVFEPTTLSSDAYIYKEGQFELVTTATTLNAFQAYIKAPGATVTPLTIAFITSGIDMVHGGGVDGAPVYYDLQGRRVLYPKKGLYILNGNKVIIK